MDPERLATWKAGKRSQAVDGFVAIGTSPETAATMSDLVVEDVVPSSTSSSEHYVWSVVHAGDEIGSAWVRMQQAAHASWAYVYEFDIRDAAGAQLGSDALAALEAAAADHGASYLQLKAPAEAQPEYELRGYEAVLFEIAKPIVGGPQIDYQDPPDVRLKPMNQEQYAAYLQDLTVDLAAASREHSPADAEEATRRQLHQLTEGPLRPKLQAFLAGYRGDELVGRVWIMLEERPDGLHSHVNDMRVEPAMRARGYGRGFMAAIVDHLKEIGVITNRGKVYGSNDRAQALFKRAGYEVTHVHLRKQLAAG